MRIAELAKLLVAAVLGALLSSMPVQGQAPVHVQDLVPMTIGGIDAASIDGDWIVLSSRFYPDGSGVGAAFPFRRGPNGWVQSGVVQAPDGQAADQFGSDAALDGDTLVIGALTDSNPNGQAAGAAYVFVRMGNQWVHQQKLLASNGSQNQSFGHAVAVCGDTVAVGAIGTNTVYVFERVASSWTEVLKFSSPLSGLGRSVAIDGDRLVAGAWTANPLGIGTTGGVYVYERGPTEWELMEILVHDNPVPGDNTGWDVDVQGDCIVATDQETDPGRAFVFQQEAGVWAQQAALLPQGGMTDDHFGWRIDLEGDRVAVADAPPPLRGADSVYLFRRTGTSWDQGVAMEAGTGNLSVDLQGDRLVVGGLVDYPGGNGAIYAIPDGPNVYCSAKPNSQGCLPQITTSGSPTTGGADDFVIGATSMLPSKPGLFFFAWTDPVALPFFGGTLCMLPPLIRTPVQLATPGTGCGGTYAFPLSQAVMNQVGLLAGDRVYGQYWARDDAHPDGTGVALSDAMEVVLLP